MVLIFGVHRSPLAQPKNVILGDKLGFKKTDVMCRFLV